MHILTYSHTVDATLLHFSELPNRVNRQCFRWIVE